MNTEVLSPEEARRQAERYNKLADRLEESKHEMELGPSKYEPTKKDRSLSKSIINFSFIIFGVVGIIGSFWEAFEMTKYTEFLQTFAFIWAPLVIAVGSGRQVKHYIDKKYHKNDEHNSSNPPV